MFDFLRRLVMTKPGDPGTQQTEKERCAINLTGYVECCCGHDHKCWKYECVTAPCGTTPEQAKTVVLDYLNQHPTAMLDRFIDFGRLGWLIWFRYPVPCPDVPPTAR